ncbi:MAG: hypothetical protein WA093_04600 [Minisyncoccales bacterium]
MDTESTGLEFQIEESIHAEMKSGDEAIVFYLNVNNKTSRNKKISLLKATYITRGKEQLEQDVWLTGYINDGEDILRSNAYKKAGLVFLKSKLKSIENQDLIYIPVNLIEDGKKLTLCFELKNYNWQLINVEQSEIEIKLTAEQQEKNLTNRIERLEAFEEKLGVTFEKLIVRIGYGINLHGELHSLAGNNLQESVYIECVVYDKQGLIIEQHSRFIDKDNFFGFDMLEFGLTNLKDDEIANNDIGKIRIFPKKQ